MVQQNALSEQGKNRISQIFSTLKVSQLLRQSGIRKSYGFSCFVVFQSLFQLVFQSRNLYQIMNSAHVDTQPGKDVYYRFLNEPRFNWRRFYQSLVQKVVGKFETLTSSQRVRVFIVDDSTVSRNRSKKVELLARVYDHVFHRFLKGFQLLTLGWSDGFSFVPLDFAMMSSAKEDNRYNGVREGLDKRLCGYARRKEAMLHKPEVVVQMVDRALRAGLCVDYLLMDSWFTYMPLVQSVLARGLHVIGRVKNDRRRYAFGGRMLTLSELYALLPKRGKSQVIGCFRVKSLCGIALKLAFVRNRNKPNEWISILTTDVALEAEEIVRIYGMRWSIEPFHKVIKSLLKLEKEFEGRSYDMMISHTTIVFSRYLILEWERRNTNDDRALGGMFLLFSDEVKDMDLMAALRQLMVFVFALMSGQARLDDVSCQVLDWVSQLPCYIKDLWPLSPCES
jgi:hypothetical protein